MVHGPHRNAQGLSGPQITRGSLSWERHQEIATGTIRSAATLAPAFPVFPLALLVLLLLQEGGFLAFFA